MSEQKYRDIQALFYSRKVNFSGRFEKLSRREENAKAIENAEKFFEANDVLPTLRRTAEILKSSGIDENPFIEIVLNQEYTHSAAIIRMNTEQIPRSTLWKSRGVKVEQIIGQNDLIVYFMSEGEYQGDNVSKIRIRSGGWRRIDELEEYKKYEFLRAQDGRPLNIRDKIYYAYSVSTPSFDFRQGESKLNLKGSSEAKGISKRIL